MRRSRWLPLHAATRAGGHDEAGREALLKYILRPAVAHERVIRGPDGLVRITLKKAFADDTVAVDLTRFVIPAGGDPLSLLSRLAASVHRAYTPFGTRVCSRRRASCGLVSRRSRRFLQNPRRTCPRDRGEAPIVRGRSFSNGRLGSTF